MHGSPCMQLYGIRMYCCARLGTLHFPFAHEAYVFLQITHNKPVYFPSQLGSKSCKSQGYVCSHSAWNPVLCFAFCLILVFTLGAFTPTSSVCCPCSSDSILCVGSSTLHADWSFINHQNRLITTCCWCSSSVFICMGVVILSHSIYLMSLFSSSVVPTSFDEALEVYIYDLTKMAPRVLKLKHTYVKLSFCLHQKEHALTCCVVASIVLAFCVARALAYSCSLLGGFRVISIAMITLHVYGFRLGSLNKHFIQSL